VKVKNESKIEVLSTEERISNKKLKKKEFK